MHVACMLEEPIIVNTLRGKNGLYAFGNNSTESEPIWTKSGRMWTKCGWLALADFGRIPRSNDSLKWVVFPKNAKNCSQNFQVLRLQALITLQWLQIAGNSRPNGPSTGFLVSILPLESIQSLSFWAVRCVQERYLPKFSAIVDGHRGRLAESWRKSKQTDVRVAAVRRCVSK